MKTVEKWSYAESKKEYARKYDVIEELKKEEYHFAETCENCNSTLEMQMHHIIPLRLRGTNTITNFRRLCHNCHSKLHGLIKGVTPLKATDNPFYEIQLEALFPEFMHMDCDNCSSNHKLKLRLVVPFEYGGQYVKGNFATLCSSCDNLLELNTDENGVLNHSFLIKKGQEQARKEGKHIGRPTVNNKIKTAMVAFYLEGKTIKELTTIFNFSESTLYRYKKRFDKLYIFEKISDSEFSLIDRTTVVEKHHYNLLKHAA